MVRIQWERGLAGERATRIGELACVSLVQEKRIAEAPVFTLRSSSIQRTVKIAL